MEIGQMVGRRLRMIASGEGRRQGGKMWRWEAGRRRMTGRTEWEGEIKAAAVPTARRASGPIIKTYSTRESVLEVLQSPPYDCLVPAGWALVVLHRPSSDSDSHSSPSLLALQKSLPPNNSPFQSCSHILQWLHIHLAPIADQLDVLPSPLYLCTSLCQFC